MRRRTFVIIFIVIFFSVTPYIIGFQNTPEAQTFTGFLLESVDNPTYISKMEDHENFKYINTYAIVQNRGVYIFLYYSVTGFLSDLFHIPAIYGFHLFRVVMNVMLVLVLERLLKVIGWSTNKRTLLLILLIFGGANDGLIYILGKLNGFEPSRGTAAPEFFASTSMMYMPHFTFVFIFQAIFSILILTYNKTIAHNVKIGGCLLMISLVHPYTALFIGFVGLVYLIVVKKITPYISMWGLIPLPYLIYILNAFNRDPVLNLWKDNMSHHTSVLQIFFWWGLPFTVWIGCVIGYAIWKHREDTVLFFFIWSVVLIPVIFVPSQFQIRLGEGLFLPMYVLIGNYIFTNSKRKGGMILMLLILCSSSAYYLLEPMDYKSCYYRYLDDDIVEGYGFIERNYENEKILSDMSNGNMLPMYTDSTVVYGHNDESIYQEEISEQLKALYRGECIDTFLMDNDISMIFVEKGYTDNKINTDYAVVYENEKCIVYKNKRGINKP